MVAKLSIDTHVSRQKNQRDHFQARKLGLTGGLQNRPLMLSASRSRECRLTADVVIGRCSCRQGNCRAGESPKSPGAAWPYQFSRGDRSIVEGLTVWSGNGYGRQSRFSAICRKGLPMMLENIHPKYFLVYRVTLPGKYLNTIPQARDELRLETVDSPSGRTAGCTCEPVYAAPPTRCTGPWPARNGASSAR
jgi:hypothetical protein